MRTLWIVAVLLLGVEGSLVQFEMLIMKVAKRSGLFSYSAYGCYCGWGGHGRPQDATDHCCFVHDCCYGKVTDCNPKTASYTYSEENGEIVCVFALTASSLLNFKLMIQRITQKNVLVHFNGYGCYCGKGGRGKPRDPTDMCCYNHDCCYENLHHQNCHPFIDHYRYLIINNSVLCRVF